MSISRKVSDPCFALISLGRCGTSLFKYIIDSHSEMSLTDECHWFTGAEENGLHYHQFVEKHSLDVKEIEGDSKWFEAYREFNKNLFPYFKGKKWGIQLIGKYNIKNIDFLFKLYPKIKVVFLIRDPRDLLHSFYRTGIGYPTFSSDFMDMLLKIKSTNRDVITIKYEELCSNPDMTLGELCRFLQVEYEGGMLYPLNKPVSRANLDVGALSVPLAYISKWKSELSTAQLFSLKSNAEDLGFWGYPFFEGTGVLVFKSSEKIELLKVVGAARVFENYTDNSIILNVSCPGVIGITVENIDKISYLIFNNKKIFPKNIKELSLSLFDLRRKKNKEKVTHQASGIPAISGFIDEECYSKPFYLYSCSSFTIRIIEKYNLSLCKNFKGILDVSPKFETINDKFGGEIVVKSIYLCSIKDEYLYVTNKSHLASVISNAKEYGIGQEKIIPVQ